MRIATLPYLVLSVLVSASPSFGQSEGAAPRLVDGQWRYPEDANLPRYLSEAEAEFLKQHPEFGATPRAVTSPPTGPIHCVAEYENMEGLLFSWRMFRSSSTDILPTMIKHVTTTGGAKAYVVVISSSEQTSANSLLTTAGANMSNVQFIIRTLDSVWIRDYGPRYIFEGPCRAVVDHTYNRPRPNDDVFPGYFAGTVKKHAFYEHQLVHGGGNYHLDAFNHSFATELIWNENPGLTHTQIHDIWQNYQNVDTHIFPPFPTSVDSTQHLDMWMQVIADDKVVISDWPNNVGSTQDVICDNAAVYMANQGYTVYRVPARSLGSPTAVHYTYTNVAMINNVVLLPSYTNSTIVAAGHNGQAMTTWQTALPGKTILQVNCEGMISYAGAMHCIVMHVPRHAGAAGVNGGLAPTAYLKTMRGGQVVAAGSNQDVRWISDDDVGTVNADLLLSVDGGAHYNIVVASATADDGQFTWTVPNYCTDRARLRVVVRDGVNNTGFDSSSSDFTITGGAPITPGDMNCDCRCNLLDVDAFALALFDPAAYALAYPGCNPALADVNLDGFADGRDAAALADSILP